MAFSPITGIVPEEGRPMRFNPKARLDTSRTSDGGGPVAAAAWVAAVCACPFPAERLAAAAWAW